MKSTTKLFIKPFKNRSGSVSYRLTGRFRGASIRQNYRDRADAQAEKNTLELKALQDDEGMHSIATALTREQVREAELLFARIKEQPHSLSFYVDYALTNHKEPNRQKSLAQAVEEYKTQRIADQAKGIISTRQLKTIKCYMKKLCDYFPNALVSDLTVEKVARFCEGTALTLKTYNNRRGMIATFLKFAIAKGWISENPIGKVPHYRIAHKRGTAATLTAKRAKRLMYCVERYKGGRLVPFFALCLFAGIRPSLDGEIARLKSHDIKATGVIHIEPDVSKVRMKRSIDIQPNLAAWLKAYPLSEFPIIAPNMVRHRDKITKLFGLTHDVLRHTYISMHIAKFRSMGDTALQAGNSEAIIRKHYLDIKTQEEAVEFFNILPKRRAQKQHTQQAEIDFGKAEAPLAPGKAE